MELVVPKYQYKKIDSKRTNNNQFFFNIDKNTPRIRVCKKYFKATLSINDTNIITARKKLTDSGSTEKDARGKNIANKKIVKEEAKVIVRNHINSFPRIKSHYLKSQTTREFIDGSLTLSEMYRMYLTFCSNNAIQPVKKHTYKDIINYDFNIGFISPKKDQCAICKHYNYSFIKSEDLTNTFEKHIKSKQDARNEIVKDTSEIKTNSDTELYFYDLQAVLPTPSGKVSTFYY